MVSTVTNEEAAGKAGMMVALTFALTILAAPSIVWAQGGGGGTPLPGGAGSEPEEELEQPDYQFYQQGSRSPLPPGIRPHWPHLAPQEQGSESPLSGTLIEQ